VTREQSNDEQPLPVAPPAFAWLDLVGAPVLVVDRGTLSVRAANAAAQDLFGPARLGALPSTVANFAGSSGAAALAAAIDARAGGETTAEMAEPVFACQLRDGVQRFRFKLARPPSSAELWIATLMEAPPPATDDWRARLEEILDLLPVGVEVYDEELNALFYNRKADDLFLYDEKPILQHDEWFEIGFPDPVERAHRLAEWHTCVDAARRDRDTVQFTEWTVPCRDGRHRMVQFLVRFVGENFVVVQWDVTEQRALEAELSRLARTDPLTGICNRRGFLEEAEGAFGSAVAADVPLSVLILDIDRFKAINDRHGHAAGDAVIRAVAERCGAAMRAGDLIARLGGEEFAVLLPSTGPEEATAVAERLLAVVSDDPVAVAGVGSIVRVSIGAASLAEGDETFATMLGRADRALYGAKEAGRGRLVFALPD